MQPVKGMDLFSGMMDLLPSFTKDKNTWLRLHSTCKGLWSKRFTLPEYLLYYNSCWDGQVDPYL